MKMKREYYIRGRRPQRGAGHKAVKKGRRRWLQFGGLLLLVVAVSLISWQALLSRQAHRSLNRFEQAWSANDYAQALTAYEELKAKRVTTDANTGEGERGPHDLVLQRVEVQIQERMQSILESWRKDRSRAFTAEEIKFLKSFVPGHGQAWEGELKKLTQEILASKIQVGTVLPIVQQLQGISTLSEKVSQSQLVWPLLEQFSQTYTKTVAAGDLLQSTRLIKGLRMDLDGKMDADLSSFLTKEWEASLTALEKDLIHKIDTSLRLKRYYTARRLWQDGEALLSERVEWQALRERVQEISLPELVAYDGPVYGLRFHSLVRFPQLAMASAQRKYYMQNTLPQESFQAILESLYQKNYVLVDPSRLVDAQGRVLPLLLPPQKKPLYLLFDDLDYSFERSTQGGFAKLNFKDGQLLTTARQKEEVVEEIDGDLTGYLTRFVEAHPDFSFDGAMAVLSIEGRKPLFGHIWNTRQLRAVNADLATAKQPLLQMSDDELAAEKEQVRAVVESFVESGYTFASRGYQVEQFKDLSSEELTQDLQLWEESLGEVLPKTLIYDFDSGGLPGLEDVKLKQLYQQGYQVYLQAAAFESSVQTNQLLLLNHQQVDPLILYRKKLDALLDSNAAYRGVIRAKMYEETKKTSTKTKKK